jgi:glycosyltransferase involved in cell wall biosynthesis
MKKILIVSTVSRQFYLFEQGNIEVLKSLGYEIHAAANYCDANDRLDELDIVSHPFDIQRSPFSLKNIKAYKELKQIMKSEKFDVVHCHSPMGGVLARLAAKAVGISHVIYTAHGFHFYKGAPLINWLVYYPVEKFLAKYTNVLITINQEDYSRAQKFKAKKVVYVPGIGVDTEKFSDIYIDRNKKRDESGITKDTFVILSVGELNKNKNHEVIIKAIAKLNDPNVLYVICGQGDKEAYLKQLALSFGIADKVKFLGYRNDIAEIYKIADVFVFPSYREGLSVSLIETMSAGLPIICSLIRGNTDLIENDQGGYLVKPSDIDGYVENIKKIKNSTGLRAKMCRHNINKVKQYDKSKINNEMLKVYTNFLT